MALLSSSHHPIIPLHGRGTVVTRHPATIRRVAQALGAVGIGVNHALSTAQMPRAAEEELSVVVLDLDIDPTAAPLALVTEVAEIHPSTPLVVVAGVHAKKRLLSTLTAPMVRHVVPKLGGFLDLPPDQRTFDGPDEQDLAVALRRMLAADGQALGASPYLIPGFSTTESSIESSSDKDDALEAVLELANALELSEEKKRRIEVATEELLLNGIYDAPRGRDGKPLYAGVDRRTAVKLGETTRIKLHYGCDGRNFVVSVCDPFGALDRNAIVRSMLKLVEPEQARPLAGASGAGLGLMLIYGAANQLVAHVAKQRFTEMTAVLHVSGSNRTALARGSALHLYVDGAH